MCATRDMGVVIVALEYRHDGPLKQFRSSSRFSRSSPMPLQLDAPPLRSAAAVFGFCFCLGLVTHQKLGGQRLLRTLVLPVGPLRHDKEPGGRLLQEERWSTLQQNSAMEAVEKPFGHRPWNRVASVRASSTCQRSRLKKKGAASRADVGCRGKAVACSNLPNAELAQ